MRGTIDILLLAERARWQRLGDGFGGKASAFNAVDLIYAAVILIGFTLGLIILVKMAARGDNPQAVHRPRSLFRELCRAHGFSFSQRRLLWKLARDQNLAHPARMFLEPARWSKSRMPEKLTARYDELLALRDRVFAHPAPGD